MPDHHRRVAIMTRWFGHEQVGGAFNDTIFAIFSQDSTLGRFADDEMISFDEAANKMVENALQGSSPPQAGTAAIAAIKAYMREHIALLLISS
jgi:hypothetical protein